MHLPRMGSTSVADFYLVLVPLVIINFRKLVCNYTWGILQDTDYSIFSKARSQLTFLPMVCCLYLKAKKLAAADERQELILL